MQARPFAFRRQRGATERREEGPADRVVLVAVVVEHAVGIGVEVRAQQHFALPVGLGEQRGFTLVPEGFAGLAEATETTRRGIAIADDEELRVAVAERRRRMRAGGEQRRFAWEQAGDAQQGQPRRRAQRPALRAPCRFGEGQPQQHRVRVLERQEIRRTEIARTLLDAAAVVLPSRALQRAAEREATRRRAARVRVPARHPGELAVRPRFRRLDARGHGLPVQSRVGRTEPRNQPNIVEAQLGEARVDPIRAEQVVEPIERHVLADHEQAPQRLPYRLDQRLRGLPVAAARRARQHRPRIEPEVRGFQHFSHQQRDRELHDARRREPALALHAEGRGREARAAIRLALDARQRDLHLAARVAEHLALRRRQVGEHGIEQRLRLGTLQAAMASRRGVRRRRCGTAGLGECRPGGAEQAQRRHRRHHASPRFIHARVPARAPRSGAR